MNLDFDKCPELLAAIELEKFLRDSAFLGLSESVAGFELRPLTLQMLLALQVSRNPLVLGKTPTVKELCAFLWICSVHNSASVSARKKFYRVCGKCFVPGLAITPKARKVKRVAASLAFSDAVTACREYVAEAMMDSPGSPKSKGFQPDYYSDAAFICARFAREYGWPPSVTLSLPMKQVWQFINELKEHGGSKVLFNPLSDPVRREFVRNLNQQTQ